MLYVEWGRLGEIGDLYVLPTARGKGIAAAMIDAAKLKCRDMGCSAVAVVITPEGEDRHGLTRFYERSASSAPVGASLRMFSPDCAIEAEGIRLLFGETGAAAGIARQEARIDLPDLL